MAYRSDSSLGQRMFESLSGLFGNSGANGGAMQQSPLGYSDEGAGSPYRMSGTPNHMRSANVPVASPHVRNESIDAAEQDESTEREDLLDQHVAYYLKHHPEVHNRHNLTRVRPGVYNLNGREISVEWHYAENPGEQGYLICIDGPLRQPFASYMEETEDGIEYDDKRLGRSNLSQVPKGKRLSFGDGNKVYSRLEAMKVAKEQALVREKAAEFAKDGRDVPQQELMMKYKRTLSQKLGERRQRRPEPEAAPEAQAPAPPPVVAMPPPPPAQAQQPQAPAPPPVAASPTAGNEKAPRTHGAPRYCAKHNTTQARKKTKPQNLPCSQCGAVIQTNYVEFKLCPTCSERDHRCMCCGAAAVGADTPKASQAPSSPMNARKSPTAASQSKSPAHQNQMSPLNLFGMPDLFGAGAPAKTAQPQEPQTSGGQPGSGIFNAAGGIVSAWQGYSQPASTKMTPQGNAFASQNPMASQNVYASQNGYAPYNAMASQNIMVGRQF